MSPTKYTSLAFGKRCGEKGIVTSTGSTGEDWTSPRSVACHPTYGLQIESATSNEIIERDKRRSDNRKSLIQSREQLQMCGNDQETYALSHNLVNHSRSQDVTEGYAADWTMEQLRDAAQRIADRIDELIRAGGPAPAARAA